MVWGSLMYIFVYVVRQPIIFSVTLFAVLQGLLLGLPLGILYTIIGKNALVNFVYGIERFFGKDLRL